MITALETLRALLSVRRSELLWGGAGSTEWEIV